MIKVHGTCKIKKASPPILMPSGTSWVINMEVISYTEKKEGERFDYYQASMFFSEEEQAKAWSEELVPGRIMEIGAAELTGLSADGKGWMKIQLMSSPKWTVLK